MRCAVDIDPQHYDLLASVPDTHPPPAAPSSWWFARPGLELPPAPPPVTDPFADGEHWRPVTP